MSAREDGIREASALAMRLGYRDLAGAFLTLIPFPLHAVGTDQPTEVERASTEFFEACLAEREAMRRCGPLESMADLYKAADSAHQRLIEARERALAPVAPRKSA